jgi:hypothetical protein
VAAQVCAYGAALGAAFGAAIYTALWPAFIYSKWSALKSAVESAICTPNWGTIKTTQRPTIREAVRKTKLATLGTTH